MILPPNFSILSIAFLEAKEISMLIIFPNSPELKSLRLPLDLLKIFFSNNSDSLIFFESILYFEINECKIVKLIVKKKTKPRKFEKFIDKLYSSNVAELKIIENFQFQESEDFEAFESEDTLSILNRYVEDSEINLEKSRIQKMLQDVYREACETV